MLRHCHVKKYGFFNFLKLFLNISFFLISKKSVLSFFILFKDFEKKNYYYFFKLKNSAIIGWFAVPG